MKDKPTKEFTDMWRPPLAVRKALNRGDRLAKAAEERRAQEVEQARVERLRRREEDYSDEPF